MENYKWSFLCTNTKKFNNGANLENLGLVITVVGIVMHVTGSYYKTGSVESKCILGNDNAKKQFTDYYDSLMK